ncbi:MAG: ABC transporter permease [Bacteroidales bacterium]|nr:ABC transporter permease [Bacteroidales bacterium]
MNKIFLIIKREYFTRVKKRSFIVMTILGPLLMAALFIVPIYIAQLENDVKTIGVIDETGLFLGKFEDTDNLKFRYIFTDLQIAKDDLAKNQEYALLYIPLPNLSVPSNAVLYSEKQPNINVKSYIKNVMKKEVEDLKLAEKFKELRLSDDENITSRDFLKSIKANINISTIKLDESGSEEESSTEVSMVLGFAAGLLIYIFIFLYGSQVMRGVIEEKTSRIIEVIISSVKPFQLMMGKIIGIAFVGLTQFVLWIILTFAIITTFTAFFTDDIATFNTQKVLMENNKLIPSDNINAQTTTSQLNNNGVGEIINAIQSINFGVMIGSFIFFFLGGYLLYGALFAAIGSAVDNEADTQQFMMPITIPLILAFVVSNIIITNPDGPVAFWFSIIPFTSPIVMMIRIPFGVSYFDLSLSIILLVLGFLATTWFAAKIYRTGILMYGKKVNYKELWKWLRYKN